MPHDVPRDRVRAAGASCWSRCCVTPRRAGSPRSAGDGRAAGAGARTRGGEANLVLPDLGAGRLPGDQRPHAADGRPGRLRARPALRPGHLHAAEEPAGAPVDARDLRADLRDLQDLSDHAGQVHPDPRALHRRDHRRSTSACCSTSRRSRSPIILLFSLVGIAGSYGVAWFGIRVNTFANSRTAFASLRGQAVSRLRDSAQGRHEHRHAAHQRRAADHARASCCSFRATTPAPASSASPSANRSAPRRCASPAASSPRSPTSAPT